MTNLPSAFERLKSIPEPYGRQMHVSSDGYYLMPVYVEPSLLDSVSPELKRRMQGKSCFNFTTVDEGLFAELEALTRTGHERTAGNPAWGAAKRVEHGMAHRRAGT